MYCEWYGFCDLVLSVVEVCDDYGGVNVSHVSFALHRGPRNN